MEELIYSNCQVIAFFRDYAIAYDEEMDGLYYFVSEQMEDLIGTYIEEGVARPITELSEDEQEAIYQAVFREVE